MSAPLAVVEAAACAETWDPNGDKSISEYAEVAAYFGLPLWAMMVPGLTRDMFEDISKMMRLVKLVRDYLDCSDAHRTHIDQMAAGLAKLDRHASRKPAVGS
jgi:hypothetical protein